MGFKRKIIYSTSSNQDDEQLTVDYIDSPSRLLRFAEKNHIECVPLDLKHLCNVLNIKIVYQALAKTADKNDVSGILRKSRNKDNDIEWTIYVNKNHHVNRQRFTIAHELAHYFLHRNDGSAFIDDIFFRSRCSGNEALKKEWQANEFAASILMPRHKIEEFIKAGIKNIEELAAKFQVSTLAMRFQLERTQLIYETF